MPELLVCEIHTHTLWITLNRTAQHNALNDKLLMQLQNQLDQAVDHPDLRLIVLKSNGPNFSAGADLSSMQNMINSNLDENCADAMLLARVLYTLNNSPIPTLAVVQGSAFGGGAGLVAACDFAIAANTASFCFSEVKLGLLPAMISPYVVNAIGTRAAGWLFLSGERINAERALSLQLIHHCVAEAELLSYTQHYVELLSSCAPQAVRETKKLLKKFHTCRIDEELITHTVDLIANKRISIEGQQGLKAFINKTTPAWNI